MEQELVYDVEVIDNGTRIFGYYASNNVLLPSNVELRLQALKHLEAATGYLKKTLYPATESHELEHLP